MSLPANFMLQRLLFDAPLLLVSLVGLIFAIFFFRRAPGPAILTFMATGILLLTSIAATVAQFYVTRANHEANWDVEQYARAMSTIGFLAAWIRAAGIGMLLAAVLVAVLSCRENSRKPTR